MELEFYLTSRGLAYQTNDNRIQRCSLVPKSIKSQCPRCKHPDVDDTFTVTGLYYDSSTMELKVGKVCDKEYRGCGCNFTEVYSIVPEGKPVYISETRHDMAQLQLKHLIKELLVHYRAAAFEKGQTDLIDNEDNIHFVTAEGNLGVCNVPTVKFGPFEDLIISDACVNNDTTVSVILSDREFEISLDTEMMDDTDINAIHDAIRKNII